MTKILEFFPKKQLTLRLTYGTISLTCEKGLLLSCAFFAFQPRRPEPSECREAVGIPGVAGKDTNNKEVPLDAR